MFVEVAINWLLWPLMWPGWAVFIEPDPEVVWIGPYLLWVGPASGPLLAAMISMVLGRRH